MPHLDALGSAFVQVAQYVQVHVYTRKLVALGALGRAHGIAVRRTLNLEQTRARRI